MVITYFALLFKFENDMTMPHFSGNPNFSQQKSLQPRWQSETSFTLWPVSAQLSKQRKSGVLPVREGTFSIYIHLVKTTLRLLVFGYYDNLRSRSMFPKKMAIAFELQRNLTNSAPLFRLKMDLPVVQQLKSTPREGQ